jgi:hypothetical protein
MLSLITTVLGDQTSVSSNKHYLNSNLSYSNNLSSALTKTGNVKGQFIVAGKRHSAHLVMQPFPFIVKNNETRNTASSSNSTSSICCRFVVQQVVQQIQNKSTTFRLFDKYTTNPQHLDMSGCCGFVVDSTTNPHQIKSMEYGFRLVHHKSKSCTLNPQQIEQVEFELYTTHRASNETTGIVAC